MAVITFKGISSKETGNTSTAIAVATYMAIEHNMKILLVSTSFNEEMVKESFWGDTLKKSKFSSGQTKIVSTIQNGIEGLSKMINSSKIEPRIIRDYTNVVLTGRLDVLLGYKGEKTQYKEIQENYPQVITVANQYYDMVIVDVDKRLLPKVQEEIVRVSDVIIATAPQKVKELQRLKDYIAENNWMNEGNTLVAIGRYDDYLKCNIKNVTRSIFRRKNFINAIPYNSKYYEAMQEGTVIDLFLNLFRTKNKKEHSYFFLQEVQRLSEDINQKWEQVRMKKNI